MYIYITKEFHSGYIRLQTVHFLVQNGKYLIIQRPSVTQLPVRLHVQSDLALLCRLFICSRSSPISGKNILFLTVREFSRKMEQTLRTLTYLDLYSTDIDKNRCLCFMCEVADWTSNILNHTLSYKNITWIFQIAFLKSSDLIWSFDEMD